MEPAWVDHMRGISILAKSAALILMAARRPSIRSGATTTARTASSTTTKTSTSLNSMQATAGSTATRTTPKNVRPKDPGQAPSTRISMAPALVEHGSGIWRLASNSASILGIANQRSTAQAASTITIATQAVIVVAIASSMTTSGTTRLLEMTSKISGSTSTTAMATTIDVVGGGASKRAQTMLLSQCEA